MAAGRSLARLKAAGAATTKTTVANATAGAKTGGALAGKSAMGAGVSAKAGSASSILAGPGPATIWSGKGLSVGLGLGTWGPILLVAGCAAAGWFFYKNYYRKSVLDKPSF
ncbi:MAG: hypothetical protein V3R66_08335 [Rhodospirillales bacterium]